MIIPFLRSQGYKPVPAEDSGETGKEESRKKRTEHLKTFVVLFFGSLLCISVGFFGGAFLRLNGASCPRGPSSLTCLGNL